MVLNNLPIRIAVLYASTAFLVACEGNTTDVRVSAPVAIVELTPESGTVEVGRSFQLTAVPKDASGDELYRHVTWSSSNPQVTGIDCSAWSHLFPSRCLVTGLAWGTAIITAESEGIEGTATIDVPEPGPRLCSIQSQIPEVECLALSALYESTGGPGWTESMEWLANTTPCSWNGLSCAAGSVVRLDLSSNQLTGSIPTELGGLANLEYLYLNSNGLTGPIPAELGNLPNLQRLRLSINQLTGFIPPELGNLANLQRLELNINELTGSIPPELGNLGGLQHLQLPGNQLTGSIPPELSNLADLQSLWLGGNHLTGTIPPELGNLSDLESLWLARNHLTGTIPQELGNLANLGFLGLEGNHLSGTIPPELGNLAALNSLHLEGNQLSGVVPLTVAKKGGVIQSLRPATWCTLIPPGNDGLFMPDTEAFRNTDLDGDGFVCGLGFSAGLILTAPARKDREGIGSNGLVKIR